MRLQNPLAALGPSLDMSVLHVLARAETDFTAPRISSLLPEGGSLAGVRKALARLTAQGLVLERVTGRTRAFRLNREHVLAEAVLAMASAKGILRERMRHDIQSWEFEPISVMVFGSAARNQMRTDSDIDIFIVLPDEVDDGLAEGRIASLVALVSSWTGNDTRPLVYRQREIRSAPVLDSIVKEGWDIFGSADWLRRALAEGSVGRQV